MTFARDPSINRVRVMDTAVRVDGDEVPTDSSASVMSIGSGIASPLSTASARERQSDFMDLIGGATTQRLELMKQLVERANRGPIHLHSFPFPFPRFLWI
jgi:hypothetical protein